MKIPTSQNLAALYATKQTVPQPSRSDSSAAAASAPAGEAAGTKVSISPEAQALQAQEAAKRAEAERATVAPPPGQPLPTQAGGNQAARRIDLIA